MYQCFEQNPVSALSVQEATSRR